MIPQYHILNGDALNDKFPSEIMGTVIVARECLVEGNVIGINTEEFYANRIKFLNEQYGDCSPEEYFRKTITEFHKISEIPNKAIINLWFEDDLFCQVNCWYILWLLNQTEKEYSIFLIRPRIFNQYGFGGLTKSELISIYEKKILLTQPTEMANLWKYYQSDETEKLLRIAQKFGSIYPFILSAVLAHIDRIPSGENLGRPKESIIRIIKDLKTEEFGPVFKEFSKRESIYGFGDLQVKRILDEVLRKK